MRAEQYPYQRFEARANAPVAATLHKCLRDVTPVVRLHDPYLLAVIIAMAQAQEVWRARLRAEDEEVLRRNGEEWLCKGGYKVGLVWFLFACLPTCLPGWLLYMVHVPANPA